jgi:hypothetical protein
MTYRAQQESRGEWSVYDGGGYRAGPFKTESDAQNWIDNENETAWLSQQEALMESGGPDDSSYRRSMKDAGRGHLLR